MSNRRRSWLFLLLVCVAASLLSLAPTFAWAGAPVAPCNTKIAFHLLTKTTGYLTCDSGTRVLTTAEAAIFDTANQIKDPTVAAEQVEAHIALTAPATGMQSSGASWTKELSADKVYVLRIRGDDLTVREATSSNPLPRPTDKWADVTVTFSTKKTAVFAPSKDETNRVFFLRSDVALQDCASGKQIPRLEERRLGGVVIHEATIRPESVLVSGGTESPTARCLSVPHDGNGKPIFDPSRVGNAIITLSRGSFQQAKVKLALKGVFDIFDQEVTVPDKPLTVNSVPADRDAATYYLKGAHQAGPDEKPAYSFDIKLAPVLSRPLFGEWQPMFSTNVDIGFGKTESANTIALGGGLTYLHLTRGTGITALRFTMQGKVEADKTFKDKHNLVFQPDVRLYMPILDHSRSKEARRLYVRAWEEATPAQREELDPEGYSVDWGFSGKVSIGAELGRALGEPTVKTDDEKSSVVVPSHGIARAAPMVSGTVEFKRISVGLSLTPRYLFATEKAGRIVSGLDEDGAPTKRAELENVDGWQVHSETTVAIGLDRSGHIAFSFSYKRGPDVPTFSKVNTFVSGMSLKY
jgi:hypothetical protein